MPARAAYGYGIRSFDVEIIVSRPYQLSVIQADGYSYDGRFKHFVNCREDLFRETRARFDFGNLLVVADVVQGNIAKPLISIKRAEYSKRMLDRVSFQRQIGLLDELHSFVARLFEVRHYLCARHLGGWPYGFGRLRSAHACWKYPLQNLDLPVVFFSHSGSGFVASALSTAPNTELPTAMCSATSPTDH